VQRGVTLSDPVPKKTLKTGRHFFTSAKTALNVEEAFIEVVRKGIRAASKKDEWSAKGTGSGMPSNTVTLRAHSGEDELDPEISGFNAGCC